VEFKRIMESLVAQRVDRIILGCTEIEMLVKQEDSHVPLFATTSIHVTAAVEYALKS
jgi:aspartate racemase